MVLGILLLRDSRFDHFGDAAGGKQEGDVFSARRGESQWATNASLCLALPMKPA